MSRFRKLILTLSPLSLIGWLLDSHYTKGLNQFNNGRFDVAESLFASVNENAHREQDTDKEKTEGAVVSREYGDCQYALGLMRLYGIGATPQNVQEGISMLENAARPGNARATQNRALYLLGMYHLGAENAHPHTHKSCTKFLTQLKKEFAKKNIRTFTSSPAELYLLKAAGNGYIPAEYELGMFYAKMSGTTPSSMWKENACMWLTKAKESSQNIFNIRGAKLMKEQLAMIDATISHLQHKK